MVLRLCAKANTVDDLLIYGYKLLGKNKAGQKVYRQVLENPVNRGFNLRTCYPTTFQTTSFAYVDDAGKVTDQFVRKVGTMGSSTVPERVNISEFSKLNIKDGRGTEYFHMVESTPKKGQFHVWEEKVSPNKWQKVVFDAKTNGKLENAIMQVEYKSPLAQRPLRGDYNIQGSYMQNPQVSIRQEGVKEAKYRFFSDSPKYESVVYRAEAPKGEIPYSYNIADLRKPGFYRQYTGPMKCSPNFQHFG